MSRASADAPAGPPVGWIIDYRQRRGKCEVDFCRRTAANAATEPFNTIVQNLSLAAPGQYFPGFRIFQTALQFLSPMVTRPVKLGMKFVEVEETPAVNHPFLRERVEKGNRLGTREFVAFFDGVEAGLLIFEYFPNNFLGFVYEIYVLEQFRAMGIGNQLLSLAETVAIESGSKTLRLTARSLDQEFINDESLISWYGRKGFIRDSSDSDGMQKSLDDESMSTCKLD